MTDELPQRTHTTEPNNCLCEYSNMDDFDEYEIPSYQLLLFDRLWWVIARPQTIIRISYELQTTIGQREGEKKKYGIK